CEPSNARTSWTSRRSMPYSWRGGDWRICCRPARVRGTSAPGVDRLRAGVRDGGQGASGALPRRTGGGSRY
ncbi:MAG: hypothetical protein AVDCRST_MAG68-1918, partial [uncultured Gemmatimonadetes bacterium]